jgi:transposase
LSINLRPGHRVFVYSQYVDMRSGFERLSFVVREQMKQNLLEGDLFVFLGKSRKLLKAICFDGTGLLLLAKRLHQSRFMPIDRFEDFSLNAEELDTLLRGSIIRRSRFGDEALTRRPDRRTLGFDGPDRARAER